MLETIFYKILHRNATKLEECESWTGTICPKIKKKLDKQIELAKLCTVKCAAGGIYQVWSGEYERVYNVDLKARTCDCHRWQLTGIPCHHVIACCRNDRIDPVRLVHNCYSIETYKKAYSYHLVPLRARCFWQKMEAAPVHPPLYSKVMGRPKKNRKKTPEEKEKEGAKYVTRAGLTMHCGICGKEDHNKKGHVKYIERQQIEQEEQIMEEEEDDPTILEV
jgi:hypothetical protein